MAMARIGLALAALLWVCAIAFVPAIVFPLGHFICHQRPDRSFFVGGRQMAVCARCTGLYLGAGICAPLALALAVPVGAARARWLLGLAAIPTALTWTLEFAGLVPFSNLTRAVAALSLGGVAAWLVLAELAQRPSDIERPRSDGAARAPRSAPPVR